MSPFLPIFLPHDPPTSTPTPLSHHTDPALVQSLETDSLGEATQVKLARRYDRAERAADSDDEGVSDNEDDQEAEGEEGGAVGGASDATAVGVYVVFKQHLEENQPRSAAKSPRAKTSKAGKKKPVARKALRDDFSDEEESGFRDEMEEDEEEADERDEEEDEEEDESEVSTTSSGRRRGKSRGSSSSSRSSSANRPSMLESVVEDDNEEPEPEPFSEDDESVVSNGSKVGDKRNKSYGSTSSKARKKARALVSPVPTADADSGDSDVSVGDPTDGKILDHSPQTAPSPLSAHNASPTTHH